jgi:uncharacterized damage-inducible protein DinB
MHTPEGLRDLHERTHRKLAELIAHCGALDLEALNRVLEGFGDGTVRLQLHHAITAERYWVGVIHGKSRDAEDEAAHPDLASLEALRAQVFAVTDAYLAGVTAAELNAARPMVTWDGKAHELAPAHVVLRTVTHVYHHMGQVAAMCRLLGHPVTQGVNYPIVG